MKGRQIMGMPIIQSSNATRQQAITDIIESVALEQAALAHILNAEGKKIQKLLESCASIDCNSENQLRLYDFVYLGVIPYFGLVVDGLQTAIIQLTDSISGVNTLTYCFDINNLLQVGDHYIQTILTGSSDISELDAERIRSILFNAFPYISVATIIARSGIATLTQAQAITAAQLAIWHLTNNATFTITNTNVQQLYTWYLNLAPMSVIINPSQIEINSQTIFSVGKCGVKFSFSTDGVNADGSAIPLTYEFDKDIVSVYGAVVHESTTNGVTTVEITNLPPGATFSIIVNGTQSLPLDAYRYIDAQDLTGLFMQTNYMIATCEYLCIGDCNNDVLAVNKSVLRMVNSITRLELTLQSKLELFDDCLCDTGR